MYSSYVIIRYRNDNKSYDEISSHDTLIQADDQFTRIEKFGGVDDKMRLFFRIYNDAGYKIHEQTLSKERLPNGLHRWK